MIPYPGDPEYAKSRLDGTIVFHKHTPVEVRRVLLENYQILDVCRHIGKPAPEDVPRNPVWIMDINSGVEDIVPLEEIDPTPVPLGYVNFAGVASYVVRVPLRGDYRQGMRYNNIRSLSGLPAQRIPYSKIAQTITNKFPSFEKCKELYEAGELGRSIAWDRDWCMSSDGYISYQGETVGTLIEGRVSLDKNHQYLQEALDESI